MFKVKGNPRILIGDIISAAEVFEKYYIVEGA